MYGLFFLKMRSKTKKGGCQLFLHRPALIEELEEEVMLSLLEIHTEAAGLFRAKIFVAIIGMCCMPLMAEAQSESLDFLDSRYDDTTRLARQLWEYAEVGYLETRTSNLLQTNLEEEGFKVEAGVAGISNRVCR